MNSASNIWFLSSVHTPHGFTVSESLSQSLPIVPQDRVDLVTDTIDGAEILQHSATAPSGPEVGTEAESQPPEDRVLQIDIAIFIEINTAPFTLINLLKEVLLNWRSNRCLCPNCQFCRQVSISRSESLYPISISKLPHSTWAAPTAAPAGCWRRPAACPCSASPRPRSPRRRPDRTWPIREECGVTWPDAVFSLAVPVQAEPGHVVLLVIVLGQQRALGQQGQGASPDNTSIAGYSGEN